MTDIEEVQSISWMARVTALGSFAIGTAILAAYYFFGAAFLMVGYCYILVATLINLSIAAVVAGYAVRMRARKLFVNLLLMLVNIPVMIFYVWFALKLMNTERVTLVNDTGTTLTNMNLFGCEKCIVPDLEPKEEQTMWVNIPHDCSIQLIYSLNGKKDTTYVSAYLTNDDGGAMTYHIGGINSDDAQMHY